MRLSRRQFLKSSAVLGLGAAMAPTIFDGAATAVASEPGGAGLDRRTLILVQMAGGNDGLNTVVPYSDGRYYDLRPNVALSGSDVIPLDGHVAFHPSMGPFKELWDEGALAVVEGVGYANPPFSHFQAMDIWRTADPEGKGPYGWLGPYLDAARDDTQSPFLGLAVGRRLPLELMSPTVAVPVVESVSSYRVLTTRLAPEAAALRTHALASLYRQAPRTMPHTGLLDSTLAAARASSDDLREAEEAYTPAVEYPSSRLADGLKILAEAIDGGLGVRVGHVSLGGFDTHAGQQRAHERLLETLSQALRAFFLDLKAHGRDRDVLVMTWTEFGRRARANASGGTDHGSATPMFLLGTPVRGGLYGQRPSLSNLDDGNLRFTTDFRSVYTTVLEDWLGIPADAVFGRQRFERLPFLAAL